MEPIKLLDISSPKSIKNVINTLIKELDPTPIQMSIKALQKNIDNKVRTVDVIPSDMKAGDYIFLNEEEIK